MSFGYSSKKLGINSEWMARALSGDRHCSLLPWGAGVGTCNILFRPCPFHQMDLQRPLKH